VQLWFQVNVTVEPLSVLPGTGVAMVAAPLMQEPLDPVTTALRNAPIDDEPETDDEKQAVAEARDWPGRARRQGHSAWRGNAGARPGVREAEWTEAPLEQMAALDKGIARRVKQAVERSPILARATSKRLQGIGSLEPPPTGRLRRAHLHLSYSMELSRLHDTMSPCSPAQPPHT
jgi:hypothetical protein